MHAAIIEKHKSAPVIESFAEPLPRGDAVVIDVETAALGGWDVIQTYVLPVEYPCVIRGEGVGRAKDGRRVYFGERSVPPFGAWAERTIVPREEAWDVPDDVDDKTAITMAIAGIGAYVPLLKTEIKRGDTVLILGATGVVGQLALQYAKIMGAGRVVGAGRDEKALARLKQRGIADATVRIGTADDAAALKSEAGEGYDAVLDPLSGEPFQAALKATRTGARLVTMGHLADLTDGMRNMNWRIDLRAMDIRLRTFSLWGTGTLSPVERRTTWHKLLRLAREHKISVDYIEYNFDRIAEAWAHQARSPHAKITSMINGSRARL